MPDEARAAIMQTEVKTRAVHWTWRCEWVTLIIWSLGLGVEGGREGDGSCGWGQGPTVRKIDTAVCASGIVSPASRKPHWRRPKGCTVITILDDSNDRALVVLGWIRESLPECR